MTDLLEQIKVADERIINDLILAVIKRYTELFPDWDINVISLEKKRDRKEQLDDVIRMVQGLKEYDFEEHGSVFKVKN